MTGIPTFQPAQKVLDSVMEMVKCVEEHFMEGGDNFERFFGKYAYKPKCTHNPNAWNSSKMYKAIGSRKDFQKIVDG
uniref:Uncharacterized protein n=1 Tax=Onchocerca volvulus TaxID=6282 RepID=A0A2K6VI78_ONCVO